MMATESSGLSKHDTSKPDASALVCSATSQNLMTNIDGSSSSGISPNSREAWKGANHSAIPRVNTLASGLYPVFSHMNVLQGMDMSQLMQQGTGYGVQYMTRPSQNYGDFNRDTSLSDSSASSSSNRNSPC